MPPEFGKVTKRTFRNKNYLVPVQKQLVVQASRLLVQPGRPHHKDAELMLDRYLTQDRAPTIAHPLASQVHRQEFAHESCNH